MWGLMLTRQSLSIATTRDRRRCGPTHQRHNPGTGIITKPSSPASLTHTPVGSRRFDSRRCEEAARLLVYALARVLEVVRVDFGPDAVAAAATGGDVR